MSMLADIAPPALRPDNEDLPIIDIGPLMAGAPGAVADVARKLRRACTEIGFFYIVNHGMDQDVVARSFDIARA